MSAGYYKVFDRERKIGIWVDFTTRRGQVVDYRVVLLSGGPSEVVTIRVYDGAHGYNEMHRYTQKGGKQTGKRFHSGTLGEGLSAAIGEAEQGYEAMIEGWQG